MLRFNLVLHFTERFHITFCEQMVIARKQVTQITQAIGDDIEYAAGCRLWHLLRHACDNDAVLYAHFAIIGVQFAGDQLHQSGFPLAVAANDAHALVGLDREVDMFKQEGAADAEVDTLELYQGHVSILPVGPPKAAIRVGAKDKRPYVDK
ncbi:hypothetical protein GCM10011408_10270 [Dyella caseinilytica]|nr:hypothetical protein GCM10011408_10270 [Dyella caseinilytica]